jgi:hypothetical protein
VWSDAAFVGADAIDSAWRVGVVAPAGGVRVAAQGVADEDDVVSGRREGAVRLVGNADFSELAAAVEGQRIGQVDEACVRHADRARLADDHLTYGHLPGIIGALRGRGQATGVLRGIRRPRARAPRAELGPAGSIA